MRYLPQGSVVFLPFTEGTPRTPLLRYREPLKRLERIPLPPTDICEQREVGWWCFWRGTDTPLQGLVSDTPLPPFPRIGEWSALRRTGGCGVVYEPNDLIGALRLSRASKRLIMGHWITPYWRDRAHWRLQVRRECQARGLSRAAIDALFTHTPLVKKDDWRGYKWRAFRYPRNLLPKDLFLADNFVQDVLDSLANGLELAYHPGRYAFFVQTKAVNWWSDNAVRRARLRKQLRGRGCKECHWDMNGTLYWWWRIKLGDFDVEVPDLPPLGRPYPTRKIGGAGDRSAPDR